MKTFDAGLEFIERNHGEDSWMLQIETFDPHEPFVAPPRFQEKYPDLGPTLLRFFVLEPTPEMTGKDLAPAVPGDETLREGAAFGYFGMPVHVTDGRHLLIRHAVDPNQLYHIYSWMPVHMRGFWSGEELAEPELAGPLPFTKGRAIPRFPRMKSRSPATGKTWLFDLAADPGQENPIEDPEAEARLLALGGRLLQEAHAPREILLRYGFNGSP